MLYEVITMMASDADNLLAHCTVEYAYRGFHAHFARARLTDDLLRRNMRAVQFRNNFV